MENKTKLDLTQKIILIVLSLPWLTSLFHSFDPHHDGLILSTINLNLEAYKNDGPYPFNQYGPFWTIPFTLVGSIIPNEYLLFSLKVTTLICYQISAIFIWKISKLIGDIKVSYWSVIVFLLSQPFVPWLPPWPSAIAMPLTTILVYLIIKLTCNSDISPKTSKFILICSGVLVLLILLTRVQVGLTMIIATLLSILFINSKKKFLFFLMGLFASTIIFVIYLSLMGWLKEALIDEFLFGSLYIRGDISYIPKPIFTMLGILLFLLIFIVIAWKQKIYTWFSLRIRIMLFYTLSTSILLFGLIYLTYTRNLNLISILSLIIRRFWISIVLAAVIYFFFLILIKFLIQLKKHRKIKNEVSNKLILSIFALASQSQIFPLFDQMHFWWGGSISFIVIAMLLREKFDLRFNIVGIKFYFFTTTFVIMTILTPLIHQMIQVREPLPRDVFALISTDPKSATTETKLQSFFLNSLRKDESVLNLCEDSNVFFRAGHVRSASRVFVFWPAMLEVGQLRNDILRSSPDAIVICTKPQAHGSALFSSNLAKFNVLNLIYTNKKLVSSFVEVDGYLWTIYRNER